MARMATEGFRIIDSMMAGSRPARWNKMTPPRKSRQTAC